jgi:hypothetical protein
VILPGVADRADGQIRPRILLENDTGVIGLAERVADQIETAGAGRDPALAAVKARGVFLILPGANPYLAEVKIPTASEGRFTLTESRYGRGELFQYAIPDFRAEYTVPKIGFFSQPVRFPTICEGGVPWMSVCPSEITSMQAPIGDAEGAVLVLGLGLGYYPFMISRNERVRRITVIERAPEVIRLFREHLLPQFPYRDKIEVIEADAFDYLGTEEARAFDFCFADLWQGAGDGAPLYRRLKEYESKFYAMRFSYWIEDALKFFTEG